MSEKTVQQLRFQCQQETLPGIVNRNRREELDALIAESMRLGIAQAAQLWEKKSGMQTIEDIVSLTRNMCSKVKVPR